LKGNFNGGGGERPGRRATNSGDSHRWRTPRILLLYQRMTSLGLPGTSTPLAQPRHANAILTSIVIPTRHRFAPSSAPRETNLLSHRTPSRFAR
jgi:hypothetical protein